MTRFQVSRLIHARHATEFFAQENVCPEHTLTTPRSDKLLFERRSGNARVHNRSLDVGRLRRALKNGDRRVRIPVRLTDETDESISEGLRELGEVYGLEPVSALLKRGVFRRQERTKNRRMVFGADLVVQDTVVDRDESAFARPVRTGGAEVGLGAGLRSPGNDAHRLDARLAERQHDVAGRHFSHVLVKLVAGSVRVLLRRPHEAPAHFCPVRLVLINPPVPH